MPGGLICVIKDYKYKPIYILYTKGGWEAVLSGSKKRHPCKKYIKSKTSNQSESSYKFIEQIYNSVDSDCFNKILEFVEINNETERARQKYNCCVKEFKVKLKELFSYRYRGTDINNFYCITTLKRYIHPGCEENYQNQSPRNNLCDMFNLRGIYDGLDLGLTVCDRIYEIKHDANYYEGLDFLLTKCNISCELDRNQQHISVSYKLKEAFKNIKYKKTHEIYGYNNQQELLDSGECCGFIFDDKVTNFSMCIEEFDDDEIEQIIKNKDCFGWIICLMWGTICPHMATWVSEYV